MATFGGIEEIKGAANNLEVQTLVKFTVDEHSKKEQIWQELDFQIVNAKKEVVVGFMYYITFEATDGNKKKVYGAKVLLKTGTDIPELHEFKYVRDVDAPAEGASS